MPGFERVLYRCLFIILRVLNPWEYGDDKNSGSCPHKHFCFQTSQFLCWPKSLKTQCFLFTGLMSPYYGRLSKAGSSHEGIKNAVTRLWINQRERLTENKEVVLSFRPSGENFTCRLCWVEQRCGCRGGRWWCVEISHSFSSGSVNLQLHHRVWSLSIYL